jgi:hypothetical protein
MKRHAAVLAPSKTPGRPRGFWARLARLRHSLDVDSLVRPADPAPVPLDVDMDAP